MNGSRILAAWAAIASMAAPLAAQTVVEVHAAPESLSLAVGQRERLFLSAFDAAGNIAQNVTYTLAISDGRVARVEGDGTVVGVAPGTARLTVSAGSGSATVAVRVEDRAYVPPPDSQRTTAAREPAPTNAATPSDRPGAIAGRDLLLSSTRVVGRGYGIYAVDREAPLGLLPLVEDGAVNLGAALRPDGRRIAFSSNRGGSFALVSALADGSDVRRVLGAPGDHTQPAWFPTGAEVVFTSTRSGSAQLYRVAADGSDLRQLTHDPVPSHSAAVSPDGQAIAFVHGHASEERAYYMDPDGRQIRRVSASLPDRRVAKPLFFPDGDLALLIPPASGWPSAVVRVHHDGTVVPIYYNERTIRDYAISRDGNTLAVVVESSSTSGDHPLDLLMVDLSTPGAQPTSVPLQPGERIVDISF